jgi:hypothetical protein
MRASSAPLPASCRITYWVATGTATSPPRAAGAATSPGGSVCCQRVAPVRASSAIRRPAPCVPVSLNARST